MFVEVGGIDFSVWKIHLRALQNPAVGDQIVFYSDLNISLRVIPKHILSLQDSTYDSFVLAESSESDGLLAITRNTKQRKRITLTNEVKKLGVLIDRG